MNLPQLSGPLNSSILYPRVLRNDRQWVTDHPLIGAILAGSACCHLASNRARHFRRAGETSAAVGYPGVARQLAVQGAPGLCRQDDRASCSCPATDPLRAARLHAKQWPMPVDDLSRLRIHIHEMLRDCLCRRPDTPVHKCVCRPTSQFLPGTQRNMLKQAERKSKFYLKSKTLWEWIKYFETGRGGHLCDCNSDYFRRFATLRRRSVDHRVGLRSVWHMLHPGVAVAEFGSQTPDHPTWTNELPVPDRPVRRDRWRHVKASATGHPRGTMASRRSTHGDVTKLLQTGDR